MDFGNAQLYRQDVRCFPLKPVEFALGALALITQEGMGESLPFAIAPD
jgi:hypothetical protein